LAGKSGGYQLCFGRQRSKCRNAFIEVGILEAVTKHCGGSWVDLAQQFGLFQPCLQAPDASKQTDRGRAHSTSFPRTTQETSDEY
jgi:hypothetical protein